MHIEIDGESRTAFSMHAIDWLNDHAGSTFISLRDGIEPALEPYFQHPEIRGDKTRQNESFPGGKPAPASPSVLVSPAGVETIGEAFAPQSSQRRMTSREEVDETVDTIDVTFDGICCFARSQHESDPYQRRVLLPYDDRYDPKMRHVAFIEVEEAECSYTGDEPTKTEPHHGAGYRFHRWHLAGDRIIFDNADTSTPLRMTWAFMEHVAGMKYGVHPDLEYHPNQKCFDPIPPPTLVAGHVDLSCGILTAGQFAKRKTRYVKKDGTSPTKWHRKAPEFVTLQVPLKEESARIIIYGEQGPRATIQVNRGASVRIGNMREIDIFGDPNAPENPREHFNLYYQLSGIPVGDDPPLPWLTGVPVGSCSVQGWP